MGDACATQADAVGWVLMVMEMGSFVVAVTWVAADGCGGRDVVGRDALGGSDRGELGDGARHLEQDLFE